MVNNIRRMHFEIECVCLPIYWVERRVGRGGASSLTELATANVFLFVNVPLPPGTDHTKLVLCARRTCAAIRL